LLISAVAKQTRHKVLLVDDDAVSLELMALLLAHEGHQVMRAADAGAALDLLTGDTASCPDVLLVDLQMPGVTGGQLAETIRAMHTADRRPLLLAMSATEAKQRQLLAFDGFLLKPLALDDLRRALDPQAQAHRPGIHVVRPTAQPASRRKVAASADVLDMAVVEKLLTMMPVEALEHVFAACLTDTRACIANLEKHAQAGDVTLIRETAHRIKGAAAMVGATHLAGLAAGLEVGGDQQAATRIVLNDLLGACIELEGMLFAGKLKKTRAPHHESTNRDYHGNT
jgi:two-component system sensor histidine kinase RpfC